MRSARNLRLLMVFNLFSDLRLYMPILVLYFVEVTGSLTAAATVIAIPYVSSACLELPTGIVSDRVGRRITIVLGAMCATLAIASYASAGSLLVLVVGALLEGASRAFYSGNNDAFLFESLRNEDGEFARHWGRVNSFLYLSTAISAPLGSLIAAHSMSLVLWLSVIPQLVCVVLACRMIDTSQRGRGSRDALSHFFEALRGFRRSVKLRKLATAGALDYGVGHAEWNLRPAFIATVWPLWAIGSAHAIGTLGAALSYWYGGRFAQRIGYERSLAGYAIVHRGLSIFSFAVPTVASPALIASTGLGMGVNDVAERHCCNASSATSNVRRCCR